MTPGRSGAEAEGAARARTERMLRAFHEEGSLGKAYDARLLARLWPFVKPHRGLLLGSLALGFVIAALSLLRPYVMRGALDEGALAGDPERLLRGGLAFAALVLVEQVLAFAQVYAMQIAGARSAADLRREVFRFLHGRRMAFFDRQPVGRLVTRVTNDVDALLELFSSGALNAFVDLAKLLAIVVVLVSLDVRLSLIAFAAAPFIALLVLAVRRRSREAFRDIRARTAQMNANMNEQVSGMAVVQAFGREVSAGREFDAINGAYRDANLRSIKYEAIQDAAVEMITAVCLASIVVSLGYEPVSFGTVAAFNAYLILFFEPISALSQRYTLLQSAMAGAERIFGLFDAGEGDAPRVAAVPPGADGSGAVIAFEDVEFEYKEGQPVLRGVSFTVAPGEKIAVVGPTGAGKTTLSALLLRLYEVTRGRVTFRGRDVRSYDRATLRGSFGVVPQDVFLFPGTVASNVALGDAAPDRARVEAALRRIDALELFQGRPGGLDARVDERGENFSAGERQLLAFARAVYRDAEVLVLDEATANVDSATEARVQRALDRLLEGRTALVIAHRLSTVRAADRILCFQRGRLVEQGTHLELLRQGGLYARLHRLHFARQGEAAASTAGD